MSSLSVFRDIDREQAQKELDCFYYLIQGSQQAAKENEFSKSIAFLENAIRSLNELQSMKEEKEIRDKTAEILSQANPITIEKIRRYLV